MVSNLVNIMANIFCLQIYNYIMIFFVTMEEVKENENMNTHITQVYIKVENKNIFNLIFFKYIIFIKITIIIGVSI